MTSSKSNFLRNGIKIEYLEKGAITKGIIFLPRNKLALKIQNKIYLDIIYTAQLKNDKEELIEFEAGSFHYISKVLSGGTRIFSIAIPLSCVKKDNFIRFKSKVPINFKNIFIREDYYDFLELKSSKFYDEKSRQNEQKTIEISQKIDLSIQWFVTWKCTFRCSYCWQETEFNIYRRGTERHNILPESWAEKFNKFKPRILYFTGGEPSLYKELPYLISLLNKDIDLMMVSNLGPSFNIKTFTQFVGPSRFKELMFSLHPTQMDIKEFFNKLSTLIDKGYKNLIVEMVLYSENIPFAEIVLKECKQRDVPIRFDPYVPSGRRAKPLNKEDIKLMKYWIDRSIEQTGKERLPDFEKKQYWEHDSDLLFRSVQETNKNSPPVGRMPIYCPAGSRRINLDEEGNAYTCMSAIDRGRIFGASSLPHYAPIGNIFSDNFKLLDKPIICWESFRCSACDFQVLDCAWTEMSPTKKDLILPIPE